MEYKKQQYERRGQVPLEVVLPAIRDPRVRRIEVEGISVKVQGLRLETFAHKGLVCAHCGLEGRYFAIERAASNPPPTYHLNLYAIDADGDEVLMTQDHVVARANGGTNHLSNSQTLCGPCNWKKADS